MRKNNIIAKLTATIIFLFGLQAAFADNICTPVDQNAKPRLSSKTQSQLIQRIDNVLKNPYIPISGSNNGLPPSVQLGMNGVPVFDQGWEWSTCVTFAITAAIDALYALKGDQAISQVCYLQLARGLTPPDLKITWWEGGLVFLELLNFEHYGFWTVKDQKKYSCGGLDKYPASINSPTIYAPPFDGDTDKYKDSITQQQKEKDGGNGEPVSVSAYLQHSSHFLQKSDWNVLATDPTQQPDQVLQQVKTTLAAHNRLVFSVYLDLCLGDQLKNEGALGYYNGFTDAWVLTNQIAADLRDSLNTKFGEHKMVITGYDDNACASYEEDGQIKSQCGLLKIRNSAGEKMGDHGDFYMSYDYFRAAVANNWIITIRGTLDSSSAANNSSSGWGTAAAIAGGGAAALAGAAYLSAN